MEMNWMLECISFNFRICIGYGVHEKISDWKRMQNLHIRATLVLLPMKHNGLCLFCIFKIYQNLRNRIT